MGPGSSPSSLDVLLEAGALKKGRYSTCWRAAVMELETSCADLDGPMTQRFALELSRCHLGDLGRSLPPSCGKEDLLLGACLRDLDEISLLTFTEFFTYCGSVCFFVRADVAQASGALVVNAQDNRPKFKFNGLGPSPELDLYLCPSQNCLCSFFRRKPRR